MLPAMWALQLALLHQVIYYLFVGQRTAASSGKVLTCVWCRARWVVDRPDGGGIKKNKGYLNLSGVAGVSPVRDTSTCKNIAYLEFLRYYAN